MRYDGEVVGREVKNHMSPLESIVHAVMILFTCGFWYPIYRGRKKTIERTTTVYRAL